MQIMASAGFEVDEETAKAQISLEKLFPATSLNGAAGITVNVQAPEGALPAGAQLAVSAVATPVAVLEVAGVEAADAVSIDVHFFMPNDPATEIEPYAPVNVTFSNIPLEGETVEVYHVADKIAEIPAEGATLALDQFSPYTFVATQGQDVVGKTIDEATQLTVWNQELKIGSTGVNSLDIKTDRTVAEYKNTNPSSPNYGQVFDINPATWDVATNGSSVEVDSDFVITAVALGSTDITLTHKKEPADGYWDRDDINLTATFTVTVKGDVTYDPNGATGSQMTIEHDTDALYNGSDFSNPGAQLMGWSFDQNATTPDYQAGESIPEEALNGQVLYAIWTNELVSISATKVWEDDSDRDGLRQDANLKLEGRTTSGRLVSTTSGTATTEDSNTVSFGSKARYFQGEKIVWTVTEDAIEGYTPTIDPVSVTTDDTTEPVVFTITNTHEPEKITISATKSWEEENGDTSHRPAELNVSVLADGTPINEQIALNDGNGWTNTIEVFKNEQGTEIEYTVEEDDVPFYRNDGVTGDVENGFTLHNVLIPNTTTVTINKVWRDANDADGWRPDVVDLRLMNNGEIAKQTNLRAADDWTITFTDVPVYSDITDPDSIIDYYVEEANNYPYVVTTEREGDGIDGYTFTVTNTLTDAGQIDVPVTKVWNDDNNRDGKRPTSVDVTLSSADGEFGTLTLTEADGWKGTFEDVPAFNIETEEEIEYTLTEGTVEGYDEPVIEGSVAEGFTVTNTYKPETIDSIPVTKVWNDSDNRDGKRPETVYLRLYKADGTYMSKQKAVSEANGWTTEFTSSQKTPIYKYENGEEIEYTVKESTAKSGAEVVPAGYEMTVSGNATEGFTVTNTHKLETREITVTKVWDDADNQDGVRPDAIYVAVYDDEGNRLRQRALSEANNWTTTITAEQQYKYKEGAVGEEIQYTVEESWVEGTHTPADPDGNYELVSVEGDMEAGFTITNKHVPELVDINVSKEWDDDDNRDSKRPEEITYRLIADGEEVAVGTTTAADNWEYSFTDMPVYNNGATIAYTISEEYIDEYYMELSDPDYQVVEDGNDQLNYTVTNTYDPEKTTVTVVKRWEDNNDQDGKRPESVTVSLLADGSPALDENNEPITAELTAANAWAHDFTGVWKYTKDGDASTEIKYTVEETGYKMSADDADVTEGTPEGYEVSYSDYADSGYITITNTHVPVMLLFDLGKEWVDDNNRDGIRPESVTYEITSAYVDNGTNVIIQKQDLVLSALSSDEDPNHWSKSINLPKYADGFEMVYVAREKAVEGYTPDQDQIVMEPVYDPEAGQDAEPGKQQFFTNTHTPETVEIPVTKVWDDADDQDGVRPSEVYAVVYANGEKVRQRALSEDNDWSTTITAQKQYKYENGKEIKYEVKESWARGEVTLEDPNGNYTSEITGSVADGFTITNTHEAATANLTVNKKWDDADNQDGKRPEFIELTLANDDGTVATTRVGAANNWQYTFEDLPAYKDGAPITYTVTEAEVEGYEADAAQYSATLENGDTSVTITNKYTPETMTIEVWKDWDDEGNYDKKRPQAILYTIFADGVAYKDGVMTESDAVGGLPDNWSVTIEDVPVYQNGKKVAYTLAEDPVDDYTTIVSTKIVEDGFYPNRLIFLVTNTYEPGMTTVSVQKTWDDNNNQDGIRPDTLTAKLQFRCPADNMNDWLDHPAGTVELNAENSWTGSWDVHTQRVETGSDLEFRVIETEVPEGYTEQYAELNGTWTITNKHVPETGIIAIQKTWDDDNNRDGKRPTSVTFDIRGTYWDAEDNPHISDYFEFTINESTNSYPDDWGDMIEVPKYIDGNEIVYVATERTVPEYEPQGAIAEDGALELDYLNLETFEGVNEVTNKHVPELVTIDVTKVWDDAENQDGLRPDSIRVFVSANGVHQRQRELNEANGWTTTIAAPTQYKYENGKEIKYTIDESTSGSQIVPVENYEKVITGSVEEGFTITNTHEPATIDIPVTKVWDDADNQDGKRPEYIEVQLKANDAAQGSPVRVNASSNWEYTFEDLPVYAAGTEIAYTVEETAIDGYEAVITGSAAEGFTITNTHDVQKITLPITKEWDDNSNQDGYRPESIDVYILQNGQALKSIKMTAADAIGDGNVWQQEITDLPLYVNGQEAVYTIAERQVDHYTTQYIAVEPETNAEGVIVSKPFRIVNSHIPGMTSITAVKSWDDDNDRDGVRPESVTVKLEGTAVDGEGNPVDAATIEAFLQQECPDVALEADLTAANGWTHVFAPVPVNYQGNKITYAVDEITVPADYTESITNIADSGYITITNTHEPKTVGVEIKKVWDDGDNKDNLRPETVNFRLYADDELVRTTTVGVNDSWSRLFEDLPMYRFDADTQETVKINYRVEEDRVEGYDAEVAQETSEDGALTTFTVTNVHHPSTEYTVTINWDDNDNSDGNRPEYVNVYLMRNGERTEHAPVTLSAANGWTYTWTGLDAADYSAEAVDPETGEPIEFTYTADELTPLTPASYEQASITHDPETATTTIVNKYEPKTTDIKGNKIWEDESNQDGARPEKVTINLYADGALVQSKEITAANAVEGNADMWAYEFTGLPKYEDGHVIQYNVSETPVDNYTLTIKGYDLVNAYTPGETFTTVIKLWDDDRDRDGLRPENIMVRLAANGEEVNRASLGASGNWFTVWTGLPVSSEGTPIEYSVTEDAVEGYTTEITGDVKAGFTVKNTHVVESTEVTVTKVWDDNNDADKRRPSNITVNLLASGTIVDSKVLTAEEGWKATFTDLPKNANGTPVAYTVAENPVDGYVATVNGTTITNKLIPCKDCSGAAAGKGSAAANTRDDAPLGILFALAALALGGLVVSRRFTLANASAGRHVAPSIRGKHMK